MKSECIIAYVTLTTTAGKQYLLKYISFAIIAILSFINAAKLINIQESRHCVTPALGNKFMESDYNILLIDECYLSRLGLTLLLKESGYHHLRFHHAASLDSARCLMSSEKINAIIIDCDNDVSLSSTKVFLRETRLKAPEIKLIVYTRNFSRSILRMYQTFIIHGFLSRRDPTDSVTELLHSIFFMGKNALSPGFFQQAEKINLNAASLTPAESRTLRFLLDGKTPAQIGRLTQRSVKTISSQKRSVMRKLGITKTSQLIMMRAGLYQTFY